MPREIMTKLQAFLHLAHASHLSITPPVDNRPPAKYGPDQASNPLGYEGGSYNAKYSFPGLP